MASVTEPAAQPLPLIQGDQEQVQQHLDGLVRDTVEATLNALLDAEADELCGAKRYQRCPDRVDTRAGHYTRQLHTKAGEVTLKVPKLRTLPFETAVIERYRRRETSIEEALVEMYLAGVSVRRVEDITEALWGEAVARRQEAVLTAAPTLAKVLLALLPSTVTAEMQTTMIRASMTAYSTAVGPSSFRRKSTAN
jgi:transposase-like protein